MREPAQFGWTSVHAERRMRRRALVPRDHALVGIRLRNGSHRVLEGLPEGRGLRGGGSQVQVFHLRWEGDLRSDRVIARTRSQK